MSKARLVITAVTVEHRPVAEVARDYEVSRSWIYELVARHHIEGEAAFTPRSRRPRTSPTATPAATVELVLRLRKQLTESGLDAGTIAWHLTHHHNTHISRATINRILRNNGTVTPRTDQTPQILLHPLPSRHAQRDMAIRLHPLPPAHGPRHRDHHLARRPLPPRPLRHRPPPHHRHHSHRNIRRNHRHTRHPGINPHRQRHGPHHPILRRKGGRNHFETDLRTLGVTQKNSRPNHPTTCGKVERFQQTLKKWLKTQDPQPHSLPQLQQLIDRFIENHNNRRPHRSLPRHATPATIHHSRPKAAPGDRTTDTHYRLRHDRADKAGIVTLPTNSRPHHIGIGRTYTGTPITMLINDLDIRIIHAATGQPIRELTLDPTRDYQPTGAPKGPTQPKQQTPRTCHSRFRVSSMS